MATRVKGKDLASALGVRPSTLSAASRCGYKSKGHNVCDWAVRSDTGRIIGYDVPRDAAEDLGIDAPSDRSEREEGPTSSRPVEWYAEEAARLGAEAGRGAGEALPMDNAAFSALSADAPRGTLADMTEAYTRAFVKAFRKKDVEAVSGGPDSPFAGDLPTKLLRQAYAGTSFDPGTRGRQALEDYVNALDAVQDEMFAASKSPEQEVIAHAAFDELRAGYKKRYTAALEADSRVVSSMVAGRSKFPVRRMQKRIATADKRWAEARDFIAKAKKRSMRRIAGAAPDEVRQEEATTSLLNSIRRSINDVVAVLNGDNPGFDVKLFRSSIQGKILRAAQRGEEAAVYAALDHIRGVQEETGRTIFASSNRVWKATDVAASARSMADSPSEAESVILEYDDVRIVREPIDDRVRIYFDHKPDADVRSALRGEGWRWSPSNTAWQRKNTDAAAQSASRIVNRFYEAAAFGESVPERGSLAVGVLAAFAVFVAAKNRGDENTGPTNRPTS